MTVVIDLRGSRNRSVANGLPSKQRLETCVHVGRPTGDFVECVSCQGRVRLRVFACDIHETTDSKRCLACRDYKAKT